MTNLNDSGTGSLREAVEASGARIIDFNVAGKIELQSALNITNSYITIDGSTAPAGGICIKDRPIKVDADHVIIRYIRVRPGDNAGAEVDSISIGSGHHIILDHCSFSWSVDEV